MEKGITREVTTILKAIAILTVIFTHANGKLAFVGVPLLCNSKFTSELCKGGMSTFLILSGYGLYCSYQKKVLITGGIVKLRRFFYLQF